MSTKKPRTEKQRKTVNKQKCAILIEEVETFEDLAPGLPKETGKVRSGLVLAYQATDYVAFSNSRAFLVRIGHHSLTIDRLLTKMKTRSGAFQRANPLGGGWSRTLRMRWSVASPTITEELGTVCRRRAWV